MQRPDGRRGSNRRFRNSFGPHGSIKDMGLMMKIIDKIFFCMKRNSRIGLFLSVGVTAEVAALMSLLSTISLLIWTGFSTQAVLLLLLSVRIGIIEKYLFMRLNQFSTLVSRSSFFKWGEPRSSELRLDQKNGRWTWDSWRWLQWFHSCFCWGFLIPGRQTTSNARYSFKQHIQFRLEIRYFFLLYIRLHICFRHCIAIPSSC